MMRRANIHFALTFILSLQTDSTTKKPKTKAAIDDDDVVAEAQEAMDATWSEVFQSCCVHSPEEWGMIFLGLVMVLFFLYFFMLGLELLGTSAKVMTGCQAGAMFGDDTNPVAGVMVGLISTVLLQSSSTTTSIIVSLVGTAISIDQGIYMVMGANIGTSVTNTIVAMGQMGDGDQLERAFAGATVHDIFNILTVCILLPVEAATGYLHHLTGAMVKNATPKDGESWDGPIKKIVEPLSAKIIMANKKITTAVAQGETCESFYPIECEDRVVSKETCHVALIGCSSKTNDCPAFFSQDANKQDEIVAGAVCFILSIFILFTCLAGLVGVLKKMLLGVSSRIIYKTTNLNGYLSMAIGCGITILVQSSSITTSVLTPLVGVGVLPLEAMFPLTLGANIGTTVTALMASMVSDSIESLQVALAHLMFNVTGIIIWYPIPFMRRIPLTGARMLGQATRVWRGFPFLYIATVFFLVPLYFLGISALFTQHTKGWTVLGSMVVILTGGTLGWFSYWCHYKSGKQKCANCMAQRQRKYEAVNALPDDMVALKRKMQILMDLTGAQDDEEEDEAQDVENPPLLKQDSAVSDDASTQHEIET